MNTENMDDLRLLSYLLFRTKTIRPLVLVLLLVLKPSYAKEDITRATLQII